jgi:hypothetical protein
VVAHRWLQREIETSASRLAHVTLDAEQMIASLLLPVSKTDVGGTGTVRRLRCSCNLGGFEARFCPYHILEKHLIMVCFDFSINFASDEAWAFPLFPTRTGTTPAKGKAIEGWCSIFDKGPKATGHSPRRSGAKYYTRLGWSPLAVQSLGRWASITVLEYIEEAVSEAPGNSTPASSELCDHIPELRTRLELAEVALSKIRMNLGSGPSDRALCSSALITTIGEGLPVVGQLVQPNFVKIHSVPNGKVHKRASASLLTPSAGWSTLCGLRFAAGPRASYGFLDEGALGGLPEGARCARCFKHLGD